MPEITQILNSICDGHQGATDSLVSVVYDELHRIAKSKFYVESPDHTLQPTALVNEAFLRLFSPNSNGSWENRAHFYGAAAEAMRRILVDHARMKRSLKRGGIAKRLYAENELNHQKIGEQEVVDGQEVLDVHEVLEKFETEHPEKSQLVKLRYFAGLTIPQAAEVLKISTATANRHWAFARAWLYDRINGESNSA